MIPVRRVGDAAFPLGLQCENGQFKLYMSDCGLLFSTFGSQDVEDILLRVETLNLGLVFENAVAQELRARGGTLCTTTAPAAVVRSTSSSRSATCPRSFPLR